MILMHRDLHKDSKTSRFANLRIFGRGKVVEELREIDAKLMEGSGWTVEDRSYELHGEQVAAELLRQQSSMARGFW